MVNTILQVKRHQKQALIVMIDIGLVVFALWVAFCLRYNNFYRPVGDEVWLWVVAPLLALPVFWRFKLYNTVIRYIGFRALWRVFQAVTLYALLWGIFALMSGINIVPRSTVLLNWMVCLFAMIGVRMIARWWLTNATPSVLGSETEAKRNALIYGAGAAGMQLAIALGYSRDTRPIAYIDDSPSMVGQQVNGLKVYSSADTERLITEYGVEDIILALPSVSNRRRREIIGELAKYPVLVQTLPDVSELTECEVRLDDVRDIDIRDLLQRSTVAPVNSLLNANITDKVVLVTGAGGSIGSEICRQISRLQPKILLALDISEYNLYRLEQQLMNTNCRIQPLLGSVCDGDYLNHLCQRYKIQTVYHAAAYKHVTMVEMNALVGVRNNIFGTMACAKAAAKNNVETFVLISSDKAVRPCNVMGASKRIAELILMQMNQFASITTHFTMVRFGNVLDSSGSVVPLFREQIRNGGPVTVTHPDVIRYFMTITEATELVIQAGAMANKGDVFILDMGEPVKIVSLARKMIHLSGLSVKDGINVDGDIEIRFTGLREGEKLYEELLVTNTAQVTRHPRIMREQDLKLDFSGFDTQLDELRNRLDNYDVDGLRYLLFKLVEEYNQRSADKARQFKVVKSSAL